MCPVVVPLRLAPFTFVWSDELRGAQVTSARSRASRSCFEPGVLLAGWIHSCLRFFVAVGGARRAGCRVIPSGRALLVLTFLFARRTAALFALRFAQAQVFARLMRRARVPCRIYQRDRVLAVVGCCISSRSSASMRRASTRGGRGLNPWISL